jgi:iron complex outermembrane receptor protein
MGMNDHIRPAHPATDTKKGQYAGKNQNAGVARRARTVLWAGTSLLAIMATTPVSAQPAAEASAQETTLQKAQANETFTFDISSKPLPQAIAEFSKVTGLQVLYTESSVFDHTAQALRGTFTARDALKKLLAGSGLIGRYTSDASVTVEQPGQPADPKVMTMGPVTVEGQSEKADGAVVGYVANRSRSASKTDTPLIETPQSISVITRDQMDARNVNKINEALRYTPGVDPQPYGNEPRYTDLRMRGLNATTNGIFQDGLALTFPDYVVSYNPEPWGAERVEVPRGPASVLYGQGSPGGLVNYVSKRPTTDPINIVHMEGGMFDRYQGKFDFAGAIDEDKQFAYRFTGLVRDSGTFIDNLPDDRYWLSPQVSWQPSQNTTLTVFSHYQQDDTMNSQALPYVGTVSTNANGDIPLDTFTGEPDIDRVDRTEFSVGYEVEHKVTDQLKLSHKFRYNNVDLNDVVVYGSGFDGNRTLSRAVYGNFGNLDGVFSDNNAEIKFSFSGTKHTLLAGLDYQLMYLEQIAKYASATSIDIFAPVYGTQTSEGNIITNKDFTRTQLGIYLQDQIEWGDHWRFTLGGRFDRAVTETINHLTSATTQQDDTAFTGRAGAVYLFDSGFAPYASYSESFTPVIGSNPASVNYKPETGTQYEIGVKFQPKGSRSFVSIAAFDLRRENYTETDPSSNNTVQTAGVRSQGIELEAVASFDFGLNLTGGYTYMETEVIDSVDPADLGDVLTPAPKHVASMWADYTIPEGKLKGLGFGAGVRYRGMHWGDGDRTLSVPAFLLFDATVHYEWEGVRFGVHARNLLDKDHVGSCYYRNSAGLCTAGEPLTVMANLSYQW